MAVVDEQLQLGHTFAGTVINIATQQQLTFLTEANVPAGPSVTITVPDAGGGIENILFLEGGEPAGSVGANALTAQVYATFWVERVSVPGRPAFMQLQYAQMTILNFQILKALPTNVNLGWPHISVATLRKSFN